MSEILKEEKPSDDYSFDALELADAISSLNEENKDDPFPAVWVRRGNGMIDRITKASIEKDDDGELVVYLDVE